MRVLGRIRLSRLTDESTSAARQREYIDTWAQQNGHTVVDYAEDLDVSGSVDPFDTPALGPWLKEDTRGQWDILVAWKLDRFGRDAIRLNKLFGWCQENNKTLVSTAEGIDLSTPVGRLIANVIAFLAEGELEAIRERTRAARQTLLQMGRWPGGVQPYGLRPVPVPEGGWRLEIDPDEARVVYRIVSEVTEGASITAVTERLNADSIPAPRGGEWSTNTVWKMIESKQLLGYATYEGKTVRDLKGQPVLNSDPLLTREQWDRLQSAIALRRAPDTVKRTNTTSPLNGVLLCLICGLPMFHRVMNRDYGKRVYRYYYCRDKQHGHHIDAETAEELVEQTFLGEVGGSPAQERVYVEADDHQTELDDAVRAVDEITALMGTITSDTVRSRLTTQVSALDSQIKLLESMPTRESHWDYRDTGGTYGEAWGSADTDGRRQLLLRSGITAAIKLLGNQRRNATGPIQCALQVPEDVRERLMS